MPNEAPQRAADEFHDVLSITRLANPAGWAVKLRDLAGDSGRPQYIYGEHTMLEAVQIARKP